MRQDELTLIELREQVDTLKADLLVAVSEKSKLQAFKDFVHRRLDEMGVPKDPESPHRDAGCRIGGRLDEVCGIIFNLRAACKRALLTRACDTETRDMLRAAIAEVEPKSE